MLMMSVKLKALPFYLCCSCKVGWGLAKLFAKALCKIGGAAKTNFISHGSYI